jgi:hypothetical protein
MEPKKGTPQSAVSKVLAASVYLKVGKTDKDNNDYVKIQAERLNRARPMRAPK